MPIVDEVSAQLTAAMRARDRERVSALRSIRAAFILRMKESGADSLPDEACIEVLRRLAKQRRESIEAFSSAGRDAQAGAERAELELIETFLPRLADDAQTRAWVSEAIESSGASGPGDVGRVMGALMKAHRGEVDGSRAREIATELLAG